MFTRLGNNQKMQSGFYLVIWLVFVSAFLLHAISATVVDNPCKDTPGLKVKISHPFKL